MGELLITENPNRKRIDGDGQMPPIGDNASFKTTDD